MQAFPHHYHARAAAQIEGSVQVLSDAPGAIETWSPPEFGGPPGHWSPETLLLGAVADCYVLSFRAVARASRLDWQSLTIEVQGVLDRVDGVTRFTHLKLMPELCMDEGTSDTLARAALDKAKRLCLITNSLTAQCELAPVIRAVSPAPIAPG
jgi:organic hydroperoxide reductase OsmC/OhrA